MSNWRTTSFYDSGRNLLPEEPARSFIFLLDNESEFVIVGLATDLHTYCQGDTNRYRFATRSPIVVKVEGGSVHSHTFYSLRSVSYPSYLHTSRTSESGDSVTYGGGNEAVFGTAGLASTFCRHAVRSPHCVVVHSITSSPRFVRRRIFKQLQRREDV
jgi:hypothetical protein